MKRYWIMLAAGFALLLVDIIVILLISKDAPSSIYAILGLGLLLAPVLILISAILLVIAKIKQAGSRPAPRSTVTAGTKAYLVLVREKSTGRIVDKATIEETTPGNRLTDELPELQGLMRRTMEEKYPAPRYEVLEAMAEPGAAADLPEPAFSMTASRSSLLIVNLGGIITGGLLLVVLLLVRTIFTLGLFIIGIGILTLYMATDYLLWNRRGIRRIEVDSGGITLFRGNALTLERLTRSRITGIEIFRKLNRVKTVIYLGGASEKIMPGATLFTGPRVLLTNDAFIDAEFGKFIIALKDLGYPVKNN